MNYNAQIFTHISLGGVLLLIDQWLKHLVRFSNPYYLLKPWLGFEYYPNPGVAFSIPFPNSLIIWITPFILFCLFILFFRRLPQPKQQLSAFGFVCIIFGAISNYIDRVIFGFTVDYLRIFTSVANLGDILIISGVFLVILCTPKSIRQP